MIQVNVEKDKETTMAKFMKGLKHDITYIVELHHYVEMKEMVHIVVKVEK